MTNIKRSWDFLEKPRKDQLIREIITYFQKEKELELGILAAEEILDFFLQSLGKDIYNKAIEDAKNTFRQGLDNMEIDLDLLFKK